MPRLRTHLGVAIALALAIILAVLRSTAVEAQVVRGALTATVDARPVQGALIRLISADSQQVAMLLTDAEGRFVLVAPRPGRYVLQAEHIHYNTTRTTPFTVPSEGSITVNIVIPARQDIAPDARPPAEPMPVQRTGLMRAAASPMRGHRPSRCRSKGPA
jgi:hypothetical protein